jgi:hypothetical protein
MIGGGLLLKLGVNSIRELVERFKNKDIKFIGNKTTQERVLKINKSPEASFYKNYIKDKELKALLNVGIVLKKLENGEKNEELQNLRTKLARKREKLWFAQLVQNGLLKMYIFHLLENSYEIEEISNKINYIYENIEKFSYFINSQENKEQIKKEIIRLLTFKPEILLISSKFEASKNLKEIKEEIVKQWKTYYFSQINEDNQKLLIMFLQKL